MDMNNKLGVELIGLLATAVLIILVLMPIITEVGEAFPYYIENALCILLGVSFLRYIFLMKHHWLSSAKWLKIIFIFVPIPIFFFLTGFLYDFQAFSDEIGINTLMPDLSYEAQANLSRYIRTEIVLFWSAAFVSNLFMPVRMIVSLWREINKGTH